jgi:hypothetical protein
MRRRLGRFHEIDARIPLALCAIADAIITGANKMSDALDRLTASVGRELTDVANEIRNHPAAQNDDGALNALADKLDAASTSLEAENPAPASGATA